MSTAKLLLLTTFLTLLTPHTSFAQVDISATYPVAKFSSIGHLASVLASNAYILAGILFLFLLVIIGINYINAAGTENVQKYTQVHQMLLYAVIGFLVIIASYWIIQIVEVLTGVQIFS